MNTEAKTNNQRLRELIEGTGLTQLEALALFNRTLGPGRYSVSAWKGFLVAAGTTRFRPLNDELLEHARKVFAETRKRR